MSDDEEVLYEVQDGIAVITLNRPARKNAWTPALGCRYFDLLDTACSSNEVGAIVVTGAGSTFCVGADTQRLSDGQAGRDGSDARPLTYPASIPKLLVAAINGSCAGQGLLQAILCDYRIVAEDAKLTTAYARRGLVAEHGSAWLLPRLVGAGVARDLLLSGRVVMGDEAVRLGLANLAVSSGDVLGCAVAYATDVAHHCSPASIAVMKQQLNLSDNQSLALSYQQSVELMGVSIDGADFREGVAKLHGETPSTLSSLG